MLNGWNLQKVSGTEKELKNLMFQQDLSHIRHGQFLERCHWITTDVPSLHKLLGPVRSVTKKHTQRLVKWLEQERWIHRQQNHVPFAEAQLFKLRKSRLDMVGAHNDVAIEVCVF